MRFKLLLFVLDLLLKWSARRNPAFKHYIRKGKARILIKTEGGDCARLFIFNNGQVSSVAGDTEARDVALVWKNATVGFKTMTDKSKAASFNAAAAGNLRVEGMAIYAQWFEDGTKLIL